MTWWSRDRGRGRPDPAQQVTAARVLAEADELIDEWCRRLLDLYDTPVVPSPAEGQLRPSPNPREQAGPNSTHRLRSTTGVPICALQPHVGAHAGQGYAMKSPAHLFDGYVTTQGQVRARCSCGFLTTPQPAQRPARHQLATSHGLTDLACEACGREAGARFDIGLPPELRLLQDSAGLHRVMCAQGSGGCDFTSQLGPEAAAQVAAAVDVSSSDVWDKVARHQASMIATAIGILMGKGGINQDRARTRLSRQAAHLGVTELEAATRIVGTTFATRRQVKPPGGLPSPPHS